MRAGLSVGGTSTVMKFGERRADLVQGAGVATFDLHPIDRLGLSVALGQSFGGSIDWLGERYTLRPGVLGGIGISYRLLDGRGALPFVHASATLSLASASTEGPRGEHDSFTARDWRVGLAFGKALGRVAAPFVVARYFGAGTEWATAGGHGADRFRYHVGAGAAFALSEKVDLLVEVAFLGEKRATLGAGYAF